MPEIVGTMKMVSGDSLGPSRCQEQAQASGRGTAANRTKADRHAANVLPVVRDIERAGVTTLQGIAAALNARGTRTARWRRWYPSTVKNLLGRGGAPITQGEAA